MIRTALLVLSTGFVAPVVAATAAVPGDPVPAKPRLFRDWMVACDNGGRCEAASLSSRDSMPQDAGLLIRRDSDGQVTVRVKDQTGQGQRAVVRIDGRVAATIPLIRGSDGEWRGRTALALASALARGRKAVILTPAANALSLNGAGAALRYMDERQKRAGTRTALVARGAAAYRATPPALPVVRVVTPPPGAAPAVPGGRIVAARRLYQCPADAGGPVSAETYRLDGRSTLVLLSCGAGAYNFMVKPLIWRDSRLSPARFDFAFDFAEEPAPGSARTLVNGDWSRDGRLSSWAKGRGLGDCGDAQSFGWDGTRFRLLDAARMTECRGAIDTLTVWRARPVPVGPR
ncbi:DUF1176 domain-containing protein [Sphingomonadaceae bacterium jetA1]|jgi:hypothetical protein|uniref:DUF1176 domain-containing protein n=1 Tax=Facivitalis istanbulensis TaxID=3075838 RepID=UPI00346D9370